MADEKMTYKDSGVDIDAADEANRLMKEQVESTYTDKVIGGMGSFGGLFRLDTEGFERPLLVASTDGVGTKLKLATQTDRHDTVGQDLVNHCVNDILVQGAKPLFFLDYIGTGKLNPQTVSEVVKGFSIGCKQIGIPLIGGETAEMPGMYMPGDYDLAGTIIGIVDEKNLLPRNSIASGDIVVGLPSNGLHTNGYSLAMRIVSERMRLKHDDEFPGTGKTVAEAMMTPHTCYLTSLFPLLKNPALKGLAHITGGGLTDNIPRILPEGIICNIQKGSWTIPQLFSTLIEQGNVPEDDAYRTFNMGIGMVLIVDSENKEAILGKLGKEGKDFFVIGSLVKGTDTVVSYS